MHAKIESLVRVNSDIGLSAEHKKQLSDLKKEKAEKEKKLKYKSLAASQQKYRNKMKNVLKELSSEHPEVAEKLKKLELGQTPG